MVGTAKNASEFIDRIVDASGAKAAGEYQTLLERKQKDAPDAAGVNAWESAYYSELVRKADYDFDSQSVRPYFPYSRVKQGVLDITSKLFGVTFREIKDAPVWHPSVEATRCWRTASSSAASTSTCTRARTSTTTPPSSPSARASRGRQIPEAALVCNFPGGDAGDPGLMEHDDVETFFHEFGHLLHDLFAGRTQWVGIGGIRTEHDFVEAPSQMLEEWTWDAPVLQTFAKHHETNEPIPAALVKQMKRADEFGKALTVRRQMVYAKLSLSIYDRDPAQVETDTLIKELTEQYQPFPFVEGTHFQTSFGHLDGYSAIYYTYMWSLVIAKDMFSQFDRSDLLSPAVARRYRETILDPGGSRPASKLVETFLRRPFNFKAWQEWLNEGS